MVEFALAMPVMLLLILGVLDAGRVVVAAISLNNAAREGARYAAVHAYDGTCKPPATDHCYTEVLAIVNNTALGVDTTQIDPFVVSATVPPDVVVGVTLNYKFQAAAPLIGALLGDVRFTASSSMLAR